MNLNTQEFTFIAENSSDGVLIIENGKLVYCSEKLTKYFPLDFFLSSVITLKDFEKFVLTSDIKRVKSEIKDAIESRIVEFSLKFKLFFSDERILDAENLVKNFYDPKGKLLKSIIIVKSLKEAFNANKEFNIETVINLDLFEYYPGFIVIKNYEGEFVFVNEKAAQMFKKKPEEVIGLRDDDYISNQVLIQKYLKDDREVIDSGKAKVIASEEGIRLDGSMGFYSVSKLPVKIPGQEKKCVMIFATDITEKIIAEQEFVKKTEDEINRNRILLELPILPTINDNAFRKNCKLLTEALCNGLHLEKAGIWRVNEEGIESIDTYGILARRHNSGLVKKGPKIIEFVEDLFSKSELPIEVQIENCLDFDFFEESTFKDHNKSYICIPIKMHHGFKGFISCEYSIPKKWTSEELTFLRNIINIFVSIKEQKNRSLVEAKLLHRSEILKASAELNQKLLMCDSFEVIADELLEIIGKASNTDRVYFFKNDKENEWFTQTNEWVSEGIKAEINNPLLKSLSYSKLGKYYHDLINNKPFQFKISDIKDEENFKRLNDQRIKSLLVIPIFIKNELAGYIGFDDCKSEFEWDKDIINYLVSIAASISSALERQLSELENKESQANFKQISETLGEVFWLFDIVESKFLFISNACQDVFGVSVDSGYQDFQFIEKLILEEDKQTIYNRKKSITEGIYKEIKYKIRTPQGEVKIINEKISPVYNGKGDLWRISGFAQDVTGKLKIENELKNLSTVTEKISDGVAIANLDFEIIYANKAYLDIFSAKSEQLLSKRPSDLFQLENKEEILKKVNFNSTGDAVEYKVKTFDDRWIWVEMKTNILYDENNNPYQIVEILSDITERKKNELALKESERSLRFMTENTSDALIIFKGSTGIYYSGNCPKLFGYLLDDVRGYTLVDIVGFVHPEDINILFAVLDNLFEKLKEDLVFQIRIKHKLGHYFWAEVVINIVIDGQESFTSLVVVRNIAKRKKAELELQASENKLSVILNSLDEVVWALEYPSLKPLFVSESVQSLYGISSSDWVKNNFRVLAQTIPEDNPILKRLYREVKHDGFSSGVFRIKDNHQKLKWINSTNKIVNFNSNGNQILIGVLSDITKIKEAESETLNAKKEMEFAQNAYSELELRALQMQMNPHFIFNALNSIQSYIFNKEEELANNYLSKFAFLIRQFLDSSRSKYISIDEEVANLKLYIELEKLRFENKFDYLIEIDPKVNKYAEIPTMLLQPFIENAINHGLRYKKEKGMLNFKIIEVDNKIVVSIKDNGVGRKVAEEIKSLSSQGYKSQGLKITTQRIENYNLLNSENIEYKITDIDENSENIGTLVEIYFPKI
ncbi:PAS domain S-box protein [Lacihabitans sp. LS3-19]|uniref:PAS domain S-box protein n=1 Tax=Lacihabitans sp. LS3-19 TaxID=2487335 RepID=UPI0020CF3263|nr:PAS domain S-box protein [Lacihabitans sp. LS3-19]MCP9770136.1 PAS domain S-box protein [Lacihabitans sp. LS3-19]